MSNGNLFCVGNDWQAIYSVRESNVNHFCSFIEKYLEEERRLLSVAVTGSGRYLFLSNARYRKGQYNLKSRFIDEIESALSANT